MSRTNRTLPPDCFIASSEGYGMEIPRRCRAIKRLRSDTRDDLLLVEIDPPLIGQPYGLGAVDLSEIIISTRHQGASLFPISEWPVFVHVSRLLTPFKGKEAVQSKELESIAWAELYETEEAARTKEM